MVAKDKGQLGQLETLLQELNQREDNYERDAQQRNEGFKQKLFVLVLGLTIASFIFLVGVIVIQMIWKVRHPEYTIISDTVINVLAVGVFAELVGVVGIIAQLLWKNKG